MLELAKAAGVLPSLVLLTERGRIRPEPEMARRMAAALGVEWETIDEFRGRVSNRHDPPNYYGRGSNYHDPPTHYGLDLGDDGSPAPVPRRPQRPPLAGAAELPLPAPESEVSA